MSTVLSNEVSNEKETFSTREPVAVINAAIALIEVLLAALGAFGILELTPEQIGTVMAVVIAVGTFAKTILARLFVTPVANPHDNQGRKLVAAG